MIIIRKAAPKDSGAILSLMQELTDFHHRLDPYYKASLNYRELKKYLRDSSKSKNSLLLVAEKEGKVIGYFLGTIEPAPFYSTEKYIGVVADTAVKEQYRRQGILRQMFAAALEWFHGKKVKYLELSVHAKNMPALEVWKKLGFNAYRLRMRRHLT